MLAADISLFSLGAARAIKETCRDHVCNVRGPHSLAELDLKRGKATVATIAPFADKVMFASALTSKASLHNDCVQNMPLQQFRHFARTTK